MCTIRKVEYSAMSALGLKRIKNEDNLYAQGLIKPAFSSEPFKVDGISTDRLSVFIVCDGMGGETSGEVASYTAVNEINYLVKKITENKTYNFEGIESEIQNYVQSANKKICNYMRSENIKRMGTTITGVLIIDDIVIPFGMGDSRTYLYTDNGLIQLTRDHTQAQRLLDMGMISEKEMLTHPGRNKLIYHLGVPEAEGLVQAEVYDSIKINNNDRFLVCSDGLTEHLTNKDIEDVMSTIQGTHECAEELMRITYERGATDNVSCIVMNISINNKVKNLANKIENFLKEG